jgi:hypothetical protein
MRHSTRAPTKAERAHLAAVKALPCVACVIDDRFTELTVCGPTEVHHLLSGNKRRGHMFVLPLGRYHHRGEPLDGMSARAMRALHGPSLARQSKLFHAWYGDDEALLARVNAMLAGRRAA